LISGEHYKSKRCAETVCFDYQRPYNLDIKVVRMFNTYGPRMDPNNGWVLSNFIVQALRGDDVTLYATDLGPAGPVMLTT